ncbi:hypothetical protein EDEG_03123 [Edhazardia aedis USNM 41457]|uniref:Meiotic nuclear division protein 1 n=1 Tax=Edhazardia aedis (strain USNM 41457) TaxID=1003232 RepID=J9DIL0_EDHAE|nr:hypothetical protein EDEG_03123 [Edhazardia aedis USNM 41457]|eukprot:EJW02450.1 hypothetical protein EDEG_03123 [Edhazardia aedis USNM 41457]
MAVKRMTIDEKRTKLLSIFHRERTFFTLKEIEKLSSKAGINEQSFKEVLQSLIDDYLVCVEKMGSSNYYWSFPKDEGKIAETKYEDAMKENSELLQKIKSLEESIKSAKIEREENDKRSQLIQTYINLKDKIASQEKDLVKFSSCDPKAFEKKIKEVDGLKSEINKITDKLFTLQSFVCDKFNLDSKEFYSQFGLDKEMDYVN